MAYKNHISLILFFTICTIHFADSVPIISSFCLTAIDQVFCSRVVLGAKTWDEAMLKAIQTTYSQSVRSKPLIADLMTELPATLSPAAKFSIVQTCKKAYDSVMVEISGSLKALRRGDEPSDLNVMFSAASADLGDCSRALVNFDVPTSVGLYECNGITAKLISTCLAVDNSGNLHN